jgi:AraC-like DNA-binding protein
MAPVVISRRKGLVFERKLVDAGGGLVGIEQRIESKGVVDRTIVTGAFWIFATVLDEKGQTQARTSAGWLRLPPRRAFLIPPRSLLRLRLTDVRLEGRGLVGSIELPAPLAELPRVAPFPDGATPACDLEGIARALRHAKPIDPDAGVPRLAVRCRHLLHEAAGSPSPVRDVARTLEIAPETVTRAMRSAYGVAPKKYLHGARVADAVLSLLAGRPILEAGFAAGFADVSRFYEQFRRLTGNTPGEYAALAHQKTRRRRRPMAGR